jgi:hypothetical protein
MTKYHDLELFRSLLDTNKQYVLAYRNCGLGDNLFAIAHAWLYCKKTGRDLIIDLCQSRFFDSPEVNAGHILFQFPEVFQGVRIYNLANISWNLRKFMHLHDWSAYLYTRAPRFAGYLEKLLNKTPRFIPKFTKPIELDETTERELVSSGKKRPERFLRFQWCHCDHLNEVSDFLLSVKPSPSIQSELDSFLRNIPKPFIGLHVRFYSEQWVSFPRYGDYWVNTDNAIDNICKAVYSARNSGWQDYPVLLCTNDSNVEKILSSRITNLITYKKDFGKKTEKEIFDQGLRNAGTDAVIEMFALKKSDVLIRYPPTNSWFSEIAALSVPNIWPRS